MKEIICNTLQHIKETNLFGYVAEDFGQLDFFGAYPPVKFPALVCNLDQADFSDTGTDIYAQPSNRQQGEALITFTIADLIINKANANAPDAHVEKALQVWDLARALHEKLEGWHPAPYAGGYNRRSLRTTRTDEGLRLISITYSLGLHDI